MSKALTQRAVGASWVSAIRAGTVGPIRNQKAFTKDDFAKTHIILRALFLGAFIGILSIVYIWSRVQIVQYAYEINALKKTQIALVEERKHLAVEVATLKSPQRIEQLAREKLKMASPLDSQMKKLNTPY